MRKLNKTELGALIIAETHGEIRPHTRDALDACLKLAAYDMMSEIDSAPGTYRITAAGEERLAKALALRKAA